MCQACSQRKDFWQLRFLRKVCLFHQLFFQLLLTGLFRAIQEGAIEWKNNISIRSLPHATRDNQPSDPSPVTARLAPLLCYACHTTLTSRSSRPPPALFPGFSRASALPLPVWAVSSAHNVRPAVVEVFERKKMDERDMKSSLGGYLLDDS